jgi:general secretion pathway protein D
VRFFHKTRRRAARDRVARNLAGGLATVAFLMLSAAPGLAQPNAGPAQVAAYTFAFQDAQISQVAQEILGDLGLKFTIDPSVVGKMSFRIDQKLTRAQLLQAFETALAANSVALVRDGESLIVTSKVRARSVAGVKPMADGPHGIGYEVVAVPLSFAVASEVAKALDAIGGPGAVIYASDKLGLIVLGGSGPELQSAIDTLRLFDQSGLQSSRIRWFELSQAPADTVAAELEGLIKAVGMGGVSVAPLKRLNGLIVFGRTPQALEEVSQWVFRLDVPTKDAVSTLWFYHPRNTSADALSRTLNTLVGGQGAIEPVALKTTRPAGGSLNAADTTDPVLAAPMTAGTGSSDDFMRAAVDKETNTLLVSAPAWKWVRIQKILSEIDRPQAQLLIEAKIVEVTLGKEFQLGVDWSVLNASKKLQVTSSQSPTGTIGPNFPGFSVTFLGGDVQAALNALATRTDIEVVSAPKVMTLDNHTARLEVGDQIPIIVQSSQNTTAGSPLVNTIDYRNSGVILNVTPRISGDDRIILDIDQEVSAAVKTSTSGIDSPTIQQRKIQSTLVLSDGGVVALGGLISRTRNHGAGGVPWLMNIPGLGALFRTTTNDDSRTELIVLLTARIVRDKAISSQVMTDLSADMHEIQSRGLLYGSP